jgi:hypothetical protein
MSVPHSAIHARSYIDEVEKSPVPSAKSKAEPGVKGMVSLLGRYFFFSYPDTQKNSTMSKNLAYVS